MGPGSSACREPGRFSVTLALAFSCLVACGGDARPETVSAIVEARDEPPARAEDLGDDFQPADCFVDPPRPYAASCGKVRVPESDADGARSLELAVMVLYKSGEPPPPDPVVYLEGGPGSSAVSLALTDPFVFDHILQQRDLVLIDQRGTGFSDFDLGCEIGANVTLDEEFEALGRCFDELTKAGNDLASYSTRQIAHDFNRVRRALGYEKWNVYGISYGSRLGLTIARDYPNSVRSLAIDGVLPLEIDFFAEPPITFAESLEMLAKACEDQPTCDETYGDILAKMFDSADRLDDEPAELQVDSGDTFRLDGTLWVRTVFELMYIAEVVPYMPAIIELTDLEDYEFLESLFSALTELPPLARGMYFSVVCGEEAPFTSQEMIEEATSDLNPHVQRALDSSTLLDACDYWAVPPGPAAENEHVVSELPALITSGAFDPITPARFGELVAAGFRNSHEYVLPDQSHGASLGDCGKQLLLEFLDDPAHAPNDSCLDDLGDPIFEWNHTPELGHSRGLRFETVLPLPDDLAEEVAKKLEQRRWQIPAPF